MEIAVRRRFSARAFLDTPVPPALVAELLEKAALAPSGGNLQPWRVYALSGEQLRGFIAAIDARRSAESTADGAEYDIYPPDLWEPFRGRRFAAGEALYAALGVERGDRDGRLRQFANNYRFFGAPVGLMFCIDRRLGPPQWADLGMFMQTLMLLAAERGLATCAQEAWAVWSATIRTFLGVPDDLLIFAGMALGYADDQHPLNQWRTERAPLAAFADLSRLC